MFKLENNPEKDKKIMNFLSQWDEKIEKNKSRIIVVYVALIFFSLFGESILGDWFSGFGDLLKTSLIILTYFGFNYLYSNKKDKIKKEDILKEDNFEKIVDDSMIKNTADVIVEYESNKNDILNNYVGDINNSSEE
ncbi:MAG TPA: hypothetical protein EYG89_03755 [Bacteroidia bacterium]|nr:hypothetical protein [Bacteroidia bacterium]